MHADTKMHKLYTLREINSEEQAATRKAAQQIKKSMKYHQQTILSHLTKYGKSLIYIKKRKRPRTYPMGLPY